MKIKLNDNYIILIIGFLPGFVSLIISVGFGNEIFFSYGLAALIANALLPVLNLNEGRRYYSELSEFNWRQYYFFLFGSSIVMLFTYAAFVAVTFGMSTLLSERTIRLDLVMLLLTSYLLMVPVSLYQSRLFAINNLKLFFYFAISYAFIRTITLCIGSFYINSEIQLALLEILASGLCLCIVVLRGNAFKKFSGLKSTKLAKGFFDGAAVAICNMTFVYIIFLNSRPPISPEFLTVFAAYRLTRPIVNIGSLVPNLIIRDNLTIGKMLVLLISLSSLVAVLFLLNYLNFISWILWLIKNDFSYDKFSFSCFILIALMSWVNGGITSKYIAIYGNSLDLTKIAGLTSISVFISSFFFFNIISLLFIFELTNASLMGFLFAYRRYVSG